MYINGLTLNNELLQVDDNFATLVNVLEKTNDLNQSERELHFDFYFKISQLKALKENALSVEIVVKKSNPLISSIISNQKNGEINSNDLIKNILTNKNKLKSLYEDNKKSVVCRVVADVTTKINNQLLKYLNTNENINEDLSLKKQKIVTKEISESDKVNNQSSVMIGHSTLNDKNEEYFSNLRFENRKLRLKLLKNFISPTLVTTLTDRSITPFQNLTGIFKKNTYNEYNGYSDITKLLNSYINESQNRVESTHQTYVDQIYDDVVVVKSKVKIDNLNSYESNLLVKFSLIQVTKSLDGTSQSNILETIEKKINIQEHIKSFFAINETPNVEYSSNEQNISFQIKKNKKSIKNRNNTIKVYKKVLDDDLISTYNLLGSSAPQEVSDTNIFSCENIKNEDSIYRFVTYDEISNTLSSEFSDVVIKNLRKKKTNKVIVTAILDRGKIKIDLYNQNLLDVVAVQLLMRNVTQKLNYSIIETFSFNSNKKNIFTTFVEEQLIPYNVYEITSKLIFENGVEVISSYTTTIEYVPYFGDIIDNPITSVSIDSDVTFTLNTSLVQDQIGLIKTLLGQVSAEYNSSSLNEKNAEYDKFIAFKVLRYDLETGELSHLGIHANQQIFLDSENSKKYSASRLVTGRTYKYVIYPLVRDPNSVVENNVSLKDSETRKEYKSNFIKNRHPLTLMRGSVVSKNFIQNDPKGDMSYGTIGTSFEVDATVSSNIPKVSGFEVGYFDQKKLILRWKISENLHLIDHFIVMKEINGVSTVIGKSHCFESVLTMFYELTKNDIGKVRFSLLPVHLNYDSSEIIFSNYLIIDDVS